ncbi:MAG TPA: YqaJ viral recombinase family protein [Hyphomicrobiaceae bacterium]|jgi:putative phage-type endonuclease|nr:YqaJ viral recombinase family protein [Hyphomicrobiaceae bacterium]
MKQHTPEWHAARLGRATASRASDWMAVLRTGGVPAVRKQYLAELVLERMTGVPFPSYQSAAMLAGSELEPDARAAYAFFRNVDVIEVGFIEHPSIAMSGASPDGFVGDDGLLEIKCPTPATHMETLLRPEKVEGQYLDQMMFQMACTGRAWCDFVSYNPHYPEPMRLSVVRVMRHDQVIDAIEKQCMRFLAEVDATEAALREKYEWPKRASPVEIDETSERPGPRNDAGAMLLLQG